MRAFWKLKCFEPILYRGRRSVKFTRALTKELILRRKTKKRNLKNVSRVYYRSSIIPRALLKKKFTIHAGKFFKGITIREYMVNKKFGQFAVTKKIGRIHISKVKKKKKKK